MTDDRRRMLTEEVLGECWHEWVHITPEGRDEYYDYNICKKCKEMWSGLNYKNNRTFTTWQDMGDLKKKIVEMGEWDGFWMYAATEFKEVQHKAGKVVWRKSEMSNWLMNPIRFPELVVGWIKERGRG